MLASSVRRARAKEDREGGVQRDVYRANCEPLAVCRTLSGVGWIRVVLEFRRKVVGLRCEIQSTLLRSLRKGGD